MSDDKRLEPRRMAESAVTMCHLMLPEDANPSWPAVPRRGAQPAEEVLPPGTGNVHGGTIMKLVDTAAGVAAIRHARTRVATARIETMEFLEPVYVGDLVCVNASVNDVGRTSMEIGVRVEAESLRTGQVYHVSSAHLVYVALDDQGRPTPVPPLIAETPEEQHRMAEARRRRASRQREVAAMRAAHRTGPSPADRWLGSGRRPLVVGHRGAAAHAPENTFASFNRALALGADAVETDVHQTRDGQLIAIHDFTLERTTNGRGRVADHTLEELRRLDAGSWFAPAFAGERVPTLAEVLRWARGRTRLVVELKAGSHLYPGIEERLCDLVRAEGDVEQTLVASFDHGGLRRLKALLPEIATSVLYYAAPADPVGMALAASADILGPELHFVSPELVQAAHAAGLGLSTWTANDHETVEHLVALGVDAIASDRPDVAATVIGR